MIAITLKLFTLDRPMTKEEQVEIGMWNFQASQKAGVLKRLIEDKSCPAHPDAKNEIRIHAQAHGLEILPALCCNVLRDMVDVYLKVH